MFLKLVAAVAAKCQNYNRIPLKNYCFKLEIDYLNNIFYN